MWCSCRACQGHLCLGTLEKASRAGPFPSLCVMLKNLDLFTETLAEFTGVYFVSCKKISPVLFWYMDTFSEKQRRLGIVLEKGLCLTRQRVVIFLVCHFTSEWGRAWEDYCVLRQSEQFQSLPSPPCPQSLLWKTLVCVIEHHSALPRRPDSLQKQPSSWTWGRGWNQLTQCRKCVQSGGKNSIPLLGHQDQSNGKTAIEVERYMPSQHLVRLQQWKMLFVRWIKELIWPATNSTHWDSMWVQIPCGFRPCQMVSGYYFIIVWKTKNYIPLSQHTCKSGCWDIPKYFLLKAIQ